MMTAEQTERFLEALERIADALEYANALNEYGQGGEESDNPDTTLD